METLLRAAVLDWLRADPALAALHILTEERPLRAPVPWLGIAASAAADWSTKDRKGREVRIALELHGRGDSPATLATLTRAIEARIETLPASQSGFTLVTTQFLRSRAEQRDRNTRAVLFEYRFRGLED